MHAYILLQKLWKSKYFLKFCFNKYINSPSPPFNPRWVLGMQIMTLISYKLKCNLKNINKYKFSWSKLELGWLLDGMVVCMCKYHWPLYIKYQYKLLQLLLLILITLPFLYWYMLGWMLCGIVAWIPLLFTLECVCVCKLLSGYNPS